MVRYFRGTLMLHIWYLLTISWQATGWFDILWYAHSVSVIFATTLLAVEPALPALLLFSLECLGVFKCMNQNGHVNYHVGISSRQIGMHTGQYRYHWCPQQNLQQKHIVELWMLMWMFTLKVKNKMHATQVLSSVCGSRKLCVWQT